MHGQVFQWVWVASITVLGLGAEALPDAVQGTAEQPLSPAVLAVANDGSVLYVGCATAPAVLVFDVASRQVVRRLEMPGPVSGLALSPDGERLYVTCPAPVSPVLEVDLPGSRILRRWAAGHTAAAPVVTPDGKQLLVCNRFDSDVSFLEVETGRELRRVSVEREPVAAAMTRDGRHLLVANLLHNGRADQGEVAAGVSVVGLAEGRVVRTLRLPNGSGYLNDLRISPDGRYAWVTHLLSRYPLPTTQLERGWMNTNAKTLIDCQSMQVVNTVLLDNVDRGAANPWGLAWSEDGGRLVVAHAGTHEVSVVEMAGVLNKLRALPEVPPAGSSENYSAVTLSARDVPNDLAFLVGLRRRVSLPATDRGPRAVAVAGRKAYAANYFTDTLSVIDLDNPQRRVESVRLGPDVPLAGARLGEFYFHDAGLCFQGWQSCASCHPGEGRMDALNWDLLNDGIGNPKNNRSLLYSHRLGPAMAMGVRPTAEEAVRAGIRHILFTVQPEAVASAIDDYLRSLEPVPSPELVQGRLSDAAERGRKIFGNPDVGCAECHPQGLFSDSQAHEVGTRGGFDRPEDTFFTPTLVEVWRTGPYLHDGSAATLHEVVTSRNLEDQHGRTRQLTEAEIHDLVAYLRSL